ncbi:MAG: toxin-antitoxin system HicB family antitoxin [Hyphomonadaceae bacterium]
MPSPGKKAFPLRLDPALHAAIERLAAQELRSVNAEIEFLLRDSLKKRGVKLEVTPPAQAPVDPTADGAS